MIPQTFSKTGKITAERSEFGANDKPLNAKNKGRKKRNKVQRLIDPKMFRNTDT